jgi:hypothetical protein
VVGPRGFEPRTLGDISRNFSFFLNNGENYLCGGCLCFKLSSENFQKNPWEDIRMDPSIREM